MWARGLARIGRQANCPQAFGAANRGFESLRARHQKEWGSSTARIKENNIENLFGGIIGET